MHLSDIKAPQMIKNLSMEELTALSDELRSEIITTVANHGGHLASNLGVVELTLAIHRVFDAPKDKIVFDVGHQAYAHKLLTGRYARFGSLRSFGGIAGFPKPSESEYDSYGVGHASTAISAALGMARARDLKNEKHHVLAVVGDGALTGGLCYEALNDAGNSGTRLIVILNDNEMSIAKNVGALSMHLTRIRGSISYRKTKTVVKKGLSKVPVLGKAVQVMISAMTDAIKKSFVDKDGFFNALGFRYLGPVDGHDIRNLEQVLNQAKHYDEPVLIHCVTQKGHGYAQAEQQPDIFHGIAPFYVESGDLKNKSHTLPYGEVMSKKLVQMAKDDSRIVAVTAAMPAGTGLNFFGYAYPKRLYDVGIAEQHGVTLSAGLASGGMRPYYAVYSSFLQRGYDQILHDVCIQKLPVCFMLDRAGLVGEDGETHHGIFDIAYLRHIPNMTLLAPRDKNELEAMLNWTSGMEEPCAIRYPRQSVDLSENHPYTEFHPGVWETLVQGTDAAILTFGSMIQTALAISQGFAKDGHGLSVAVINCASIKPMDEKLLTLMLKKMPVFTLEEHSLSCGFGSAVAEFAVMNEVPSPLYMYGIPDTFVQHGDRERLMRYLGLTSEQIYTHMRIRLSEYQGGKTWRIS